MSDPAVLEFFLSAKVASGGDDMVAIRAIRQRFGLDLTAAKEVMHKASGASSSLSDHQGQFAADLFRALDDPERR